MKAKWITLTGTAFTVWMLALFMGAVGSTAQTETVLYSFGATSTDATFPYSGVAFDVSGNLVGTSVSGGDNGWGSVFELTPQAGGSWTETVLHSFGAGSDGASPSSSLAIDSAGTLYGTSSGGGLYGYGTVFKLGYSQSHGWSDKVLHSFNFNGKDGYVPQGGGPILDKNGNLYGSTPSGGIYNLGTVFELSPKAGGGWSETLLHSFGDHTDGVSPFGSLILDAAGNLYGTTLSGGAHGCGTVFELIRRTGGGWMEKILHNFNNKAYDGCYPAAGLVFDAAGNIYSTTQAGGTYNNGTVFELSPQLTGNWTKTLLHSFDYMTDGISPNAGVTFDGDGNLYSTTQGGGAYGSGTVFELSPAVGAGWTVTVLHSFGSGADGASPTGGIVRDAAGNLYSTTQAGGTYSYGTVFEIMP
jgi:uncharacterized repeat protein (TIGR03803 family)